MRNNAGFTLIELIVAMVLSIMVAGLVYASWNAITRHTTVQQRRTMLDMDAQRIGRQISEEIRRSPAIVSLERSSVTLVSPLNGDTVTYSLSNEVITRNATPLALQSRNARIGSFSLSTERGDNASAAPDILITVSITVSNTWGDSSMLSFKVMAKEPSEAGTGEIRGWNF